MPTFRGHVVWLTREQGGRASGPPPLAATGRYRANAFVPPCTALTGLASFELRPADDGGQVGEGQVKGAWLIPQDDPRFDVEAGTVIVITEGPRAVAYFHVEEVA